MTSDKVDLGSISILIPASKSGEKLAQEELFAELKGYLESVAERKLDPVARQKAGTSDIVQASFIRIIENFEQFRGETSGELKAWIRTIVTNEVNHVRRHFATGKRNVNREVPISPVDSTSPGISPADRYLTPSSDALKAEQNRKFHEVLKQLAPDDAQVIRLRNIDSLSFKEIGEQMDRSEQAASQLWYRAILKFESILRASNEFDDE